MHTRTREPRAGGRGGGRFPRPKPGAAEECPGSRWDVLNAERDGGLYSDHKAIVPKQVQSLEFEPRLPVATAATMWSTNHYTDSVIF